MTSTTVLAILSLAALVAAQGYGYTGGYGGGYPGSSSSSGSGGSSGSGFAGASFAGFDYEQASTIRLAHGVMASLAFVLFFPAGAITIRLIPSKVALYLHVAFQVLGYLLFIAAFGLGVYLAREVEFGDFKLINEYHPIIGIVVFAFIALQPLLGILHHIFFKKHSKRTIWSYAHIWLGRVIVTLGIINGGLGLLLANNTRRGEIAYGVVAGIIWLIWMGAAIYGEIKRKQKPSNDAASARKEQQSGSDYSPPHSETTQFEHGHGGENAQSRGVHEYYGRP